MRYIIAVSGGIDSVVLLDLMSRTEKDLVVAHFDHGIREDSASDARFVEALANRYKIQFVCRRESWGLMPVKNWRAKGVMNFCVAWRRILMA